MQVEFDRALYLDRAGDQPGGGMAAMATLLRNIITALADEALAVPTPLAAE
ncbi:hypothetical protein [Sphingomonas aliaeris]|uniref:hypothetical protein n=1 Tax=Sphingomonas aliaeris TaxID=2759526 RepID=UPI00384A83C5